MSTDKFKSTSQFKDTSQIKINVKQDAKLYGRYFTMDQKHDTLECIFCCFCQGANEYGISQSDPNFNVDNKLGVIKEESDCCSRLICVCNRPFEAKLKLFNQQVAVAQRPCRCCIQYMPCNQNQIVITNKTGRVLGYCRVQCWCFAGNVFACADAVVHIYSGQTDELIYTVQGNYCQKSILCPCFRCCYCPNVQYQIFDKVSLKVGKIFNIFNGCCTQFFSRTSKFGLQMPAKAEQEEKILILYAAMYLDYLRYETPYFCLGIR